MSSSEKPVSDDLETRVTKIETKQQELEHDVIAGLGAVSLGVQLVYAQGQQHAQQLQRVEDRMGGMDDRLGRIEALLERLVPPQEPASE